MKSRAGPLMVFALVMLFALIATTTIAVTTPIAAWLPLMAAAVLGIGLFAWATMVGLARIANRKDNKTNNYLVQYTLIGLAAILAAGALVFGTAPMQAIAVSSVLILTTTLVINLLFSARAMTFVQQPTLMKTLGNLRTSAANLTASVRRSVTGFLRTVPRPATQLRT